MKLELELAVRYVGYGLSCSCCGRVRETTRYVLRNAKTEELLQEFRLCDACQDRGHVIRFLPVIPGYDDKQERTRRVRISQKLERGLASDVNGKVQPGSGNQDAKADVRVIGKWRLEHKYTDNIKNYKLEASDLAAVSRHANLAGEWPALVLNFRSLKKKYVTVPYEIFLQMMEKLHEAEPDLYSRPKSRK